MPGDVEMVENLVRIGMRIWFHYSSLQPIRDLPSIRCRR